MAGVLVSSAAQAAIAAAQGGGLTWQAIVGVLSLFGIGGVFVQIARNKPTLQRIANDAEQAKYNNRRKDMDDMRERIVALENKVEAANVKATAAQMQTTYLTAAFGLVSSELGRKDPDNQVLKQARDLVAQATHTDDNFGAQIAKLSLVKGTGE